MLPILALFGLAFAAAFLPEPADDTPDDLQTASGDLNASATSTGETEDESSPLTYAAGTSFEATDTLSAWRADETLDGTDGDDVQSGWDGDDVMAGAAGADWMDGGEGDDLLIGNDDDEGDEMIGGEGHDEIWLGDQDIATGGSGDDRFFMDDQAEDASVIEDYNPDDDTVAVFYDPAAPAPKLAVDETEAGMRLWADDQLLAVFSGTTELDLDLIHLVADQTAA